MPNHQRPESVALFTHEYAAEITAGTHETRWDAFLAVLDRWPELREQIGDGLRWADENSLYQRQNTYLRKAYPGLAGKRGPYKKTLIREGWSSDEIREALDDELSQRCARAEQRLVGERDRNRLNNRAFREKARFANALEAVHMGLTDAIDLWRDRLAVQTRSGAFNPEASAMIVHLSDLHFNELIDLVHNKYDFIVASKRLEKLASYVKLQAEAHGIEHICIAFGGDLMNSDRRLDEKYAQATNRANACVLAAHILSQFILDLAADYFVDCVAITGNESRVNPELGWSNEAATDSYDAIIYNMIRGLLSDQSAALRLHKLQANEVTIELHGHRFLLLHGHQLNADDQRKVQSIIGRKSAQGETITHVLCGHVHSTRLGDYVSRSASLCGSNAYSEDGLQYASKACQNLHVVSKEGHNSIRVDLQNADEFSGYDVIEELAYYNAKSVTKAAVARAIPRTVVRVI